MQENAQENLIDKKLSEEYDKNAIETKIELYRLRYELAYLKNEKIEPKDEKKIRL